MTRSRSTRVTDNLKAELLEKYRQREPQQFYQLDGWLAGDDVMGCDRDGHAITGCQTSELMRGSDVRVLVKRGVRTASAVTLLRKILAWVERDGLGPPPSKSLVVRINNGRIGASCGVCGGVVEDISVGPAVFVGLSGALACDWCADRYAPELRQMVRDVRRLGHRQQAHDEPDDDLVVDVPWPTR